MKMGENESNEEKLSQDMNMRACLISLYLSLSHSFFIVLEVGEELLKLQKKGANLVDLLSENSFSKCLSIF
jgi:hypothetical protein